MRPVVDLAPSRAGWLCYLAPTAANQIAAARSTGAAQVEPCGRCPDVLLAPARTSGRTEAVEMRLEVFHRAEGALLNHLTDRDSRCPSGGYGRRKQTLFLLTGAISSRASCISRVKAYPPPHVCRRSARASRACVALGEAMTTSQRPDAGPQLPGGDHRDVRQVAFDLLFIAGSDERRGFSPGTNG